jgi:two-component system, OmpR family, phosphate regulon response regulator PhoB
MTGTSPHVLLVDDAALNQELLSAYLSDFDCTIELACNGTEAMVAVERRKPSLIVLDVMMPGINGYEICRQIKTKVSTSDVPVLLLSALCDEDHQRRARDAGADDVAAKPVDQHEFLTRVRNLLR